MPHPTLVGPGGLVVEVLEHGATLHRVRVPMVDGLRDVVLTVPKAERCRSTDFLGATVGRYANRIAGGRFELDGREHQLPVNDRGNTLHGGDGFDRREWSVTDRSTTHVELALVSEDGDQGFPGRLEVSCRYEVLGSAAEPTLRTTYAARTDAPTAVNLTSHPYFNLDGACPPVEHCGQRLSVPAESYLPVDETGLPTGEVADVEGTAYDLRAPRRLGELAPIDHSYAVAGEGLRPVAELVSTWGDLTMELWSDQPGVHVYTGAGMGRSAPGHPGAGTGVALEPQHFPNSVHHPEWPSTVLRPGEEYEWVAETRFRDVLG